MRHFSVRHCDQEEVREVIVIPFGGTGNGPAVFVLASPIHPRHSGGSLNAREQKVNHIGNLPVA